MKVALFDKNGKKSENKFELSNSVFGSKINKRLLSQAVYVYLANQRQANAHTKDRGDVSGGGKKPWRQKGTGRARVGSNRSPIWRGGGVTFGPTNERNYKKRMPRKMKVSAIKSAFSNLMKENKILVMQKPEFKEENYTKQMLKITGNLGVDRNILFIQKGIDINFVKAARNLKEVIVKPVNELNTYLILNSKWVVLTDEAAEEIDTIWSEKKTTQKSEIKTELTSEKKAVKKIVKKPTKSADKKTKTVKKAKK